jgi:tetratricopeptide (TPR) repeat protein
VNPSAVIDWQSALAVLVVGLAVGGALLWKTRRSPAAPAPPASAPPLEVRDLEARRDTLLQQLRELDDTASKRTPEQLARERYALELAAAAVMRDLDRRVPAAVVAPVAGVPAGPDRGAMRGFLWGVGTATAIAALMFFVNRSATPRDEGGSLTGTAGRLSEAERAPGGAGGMGGGTAATGAGSDDIDAHLASAREHLTKQDLMGVWNDTKFVLEREPGNPVALSYQALVRLAMGQADVAEAMLKRAMAAAPDLLDAHLHLAVVYARTGRLAQADATIRAAMSRFPEQREGLTALMQELKQTAAEEAANPAAAGAHAGVAPPGDAVPTMETADGRPGAAPMMGASNDAGMPARLSGVVELDESKKGMTGGMVFVTVRAVGVTSGPPVAVKRFAAGALPGAFAITTADSMLGQELPERVRIEARLDRDGDPLTRDPSDPSARLEDVKLGSTGLRLVLK